MRTDELTYKTERGTDLENELMVDEGRTVNRVWDGHVHTAVFNMDNQ